MLLVLVAFQFFLSCDAVALKEDLYQEKNVDTEEICCVGTVVAVKLKNKNKNFYFLETRKTKNNSFFSSIFLKHLLRVESRKLLCINIFPSHLLTCPHTLSQKFKI